ncbi:hypothetical protein [Stenotrophomonas sp. MMGLT7]|uniref:hypothetical protein n=1 Tax=Stenotrophomonas sp. MMGLT7 TaxID=2901227 RepID=UPI001E33E0E1|nr:hypothetical protein [Stenotrophomonas sp. MMGLT7]MCD7099078.1 hypothetical protein [Stenotrophomonas sp. MMGLT7]
MGEIKLNLKDSMRILNNEDAAPDARVIAAFAVAFLETFKHADEINPETRAIVRKLMHMSLQEIYDTEEQ